MTSEDSLVSLPPRDSLLVLRNDIKAEAIAERKKQSLKNALGEYDAELHYFSDKFFTKSAIFDTLSPAQKEELAKIYVSFCKRRIALISSPYAAFWVGIVYLGTIINPLWFLMFFPWLLLSMVGLFCWSGWADYIDFLLARRTIRKSDKEKNILSG